MYISYMFYEFEVNFGGFLIKRKHRLRKRISEIYSSYFGRTSFHGAEAAGQGAVVRHPGVVLHAWWWGRHQNLSRIKMRTTNVHTF